MDRDTDPLTGDVDRPTASDRPSGGADPQTDGAEQRRPSLRIPRATYRLQFHAGFGFAEARRLIPYLHRLGISDLYASPLFAARPGSAHGYDVTDPTRLNPELGSHQDFEALVEELHRHGMGLLLDIVPNHMAAHPENPWWTDVLEHGPSSAYADFFDIDWGPPGSPAERLILPVLGREPAELLDSGDLLLTLESWPDDGGAESQDPPAPGRAGLFIRYHETRWPVEVGSWAPVLEGLREIDATDPTPSAHAPSIDRSIDGFLEQLARTAAEMPRFEQHHDATTSEGRAVSPEREPSETTVTRRRLAEQAKSVLARAWALRPILDGDLTRLARARPELLADLLAAQPYRPVHFVAAERLNYRRFFDVSDLAGLRQEDPRVFRATHDFLLALVRDGAVTGLRVDHIDGLRDPLGYLERLQGALAAITKAPAASHLGPAHAFAPPFYVLVEKILSGDERLPPEWPVQGTTGYDFLNDLSRLLVDRDGLEKLDAFYARLTEEHGDFDITRYQAKRLVLTTLFAPEVARLTERLAELIATIPSARTISPAALGQALVEITACLPVYRTYIRANQPHGAHLEERDRRLIDEAVTGAQRRNPGQLASAFALLRRMLTLRLTQTGPCGSPDGRRGGPTLSTPADADGGALDFVLRWQQLSGPAMAKGLEDTAFYRYNRLISLHEVGGDVDVAAHVRDALHRRNLMIPSTWPSTMNATSTHDTKRSEDVRARIDVLSELSEEWSRRVDRWREMNRGARPLVGGRAVPGANDEFLLYQTLVGAWPLDESPSELSEFGERLSAFLVKAAREEKEHTGWLRPDLEYEAALTAFSAAILRSPAAERERPTNPFLADFIPFQRRVSWFGALNSVVQTLVKITSPGVPDFYQGSELWDLSLVDPDNRRPVDFAQREAILEQLENELGAVPPPHGAGHSEAAAEAAAKTAAEPVNGHLARRRLARELLHSWTDGRLKLYVVRESLHLRARHEALFLHGGYLPLEVKGRHARSLFAFARRLPPHWVIVVVPRLLTRLVEVGESPLGGVWEDTEILLPPGTPDRWREQLAGAEVTTRAGLRASALFTALPFALLVGQEDPREERAGTGRRLTPSNSP